MVRRDGHQPLRDAPFPTSDDPPDILVDRLPAVFPRFEHRRPDLGQHHRRELVRGIIPIEPVDLLQGRFDAMHFRRGLAVLLIVSIAAFGIEQRQLPDRDVGGLLDLPGLPLGDFISVSPMGFRGSVLAQVDPLAVDFDVGLTVGLVVTVARDVF